jgi:ABC-type multidrug transport system fused ATPase/permease subunit
MRTLPVADPGTPDHRSPTRYLLWLVRRQWRTLSVGVMFGIVWMVSQAFVPAVLGQAIDAITARDQALLTAWGAALLGLGIVQAAAGIARHRCAVHNFLSGAYRTVQVTIRATNRLGATLPRKLASGDVVAIGTADISHIGNALDVTARGVGAVVAIITIAVILLSTSVPLGLVVLIGVPLMTALVATLIRPLHRRQHDYREQQGALTTRAADIVAGLRVLRGVGGESQFSHRYRDESQQLRAAGMRVAKVESLLDAAQILLPGILVVVVTWLGARSALAGDISAGQMVAFYGYAMFLMRPLRTLTEWVHKTTRAHVAARRVVRLLALEPELADPPVPGRRPDPYGELTDPASGLRVPPGSLTAVAADDPADAAAIADRLGRYTDGEVNLDGVRLSELSRATVRELILVAEHDARLFSGHLRTTLDVTADGDADGDADGRDGRILAALRTASALDILEQLPDGLDAPVVERGREFSGGQQQRLRLARALLVDPPVLALVEPTSAVDAHTEARIAAALGAARRGRTTVVCSTSPLVLDRADRVAFVAGGTVRAVGHHRELLDTDPDYAAVVTRGEQP